MTKIMMLQVHSCTETVKQQEKHSGSTTQLPSVTWVKVEKIIPPVQGLLRAHEIWQKSKRTAEDGQLL